jgi:hypothetical protein
MAAGDVVTGPDLTSTAAFEVWDSTRALHVGRNSQVELTSLATETFAVADAGSASATQQDWVEVTVGGNTGYIHVFAAK